MNRRRALIGLVLVLLALAGAGAWWQFRDRETQPADPGLAPTASGVSNTSGLAAPSATEVVTVAQENDSVVVAGATPMAERVAVIGLLNKRNGETRDLTLKPGQATRVGNAIVRLRACERTAPWEPDQYTGAFLQLDVEGTDKRWRRVFSGWVYKERPALNVVQHPVYDVWPKNCAMTFPETGGETVNPSASTRPRSSVPKSAAGSSSPTPTRNPPAEAPSASDNSVE